MFEDGATRAQLLAELAAGRQRLLQLEDAEAEHERAVQALRESEERYRQLVEAVPGVLYEYLDQGGGAYYSAQVEHLLGYSPKYLREHPMLWHDSIHPDDLPAVDRAIEASGQTGRIELEYRIKNAAGQWRWLLDRTVRVTRDDGKPTRIEGLAVDITERKRAEEALRSSEALLDAIIENIPDMIFLKDAEDLRFVRFNRAGEELLGHSRDELVGKNDYDFFPRDEADFFTSKDRAVLAGGAMLDIAEEPIETRCRGRRLLHTKKVPLLDANGQPQYLLGISEDVTERRQAEQALRAERDRAQLYLDIAAVGLIRLDSEGKVALINREGCRILECAEHEAIGQNWFATFLPERLRGPVSEVFKQLMAGDTSPVERYENAVLTKSGRERILAFHNAVTRDAAGEIDGVLCSAEDISDLKKAEAERLALERQVYQVQKLESLGTLAGGIAHDFNNILAGLLAHADLALTELPADAPSRQDLLDIQRAGWRAAELTAQMLAYSGKGRFVVEDLDLSALVGGMSRLLASATSTRTTLSYELALGLPPVRADAAQLRQVVLNLVLNAVDASAETNAHVLVKTYTTECDQSCVEAARWSDELPLGLYVTLEIRDQGSGMDNETRARIFDPFFTTKATGRGLGLAAVQGIVRGHRGAIVVDSALGQGATFRVLLPASAQTATPLSPAAPQEQVAVRTRATLLVVDDEAMLRKALTHMLKRAGYAVFAAFDGLDGVDVFRQHCAEIDCVLLDLQMPRLDGERAYAEIRKISPDVPVILTSGYSERESMAPFRDKGLAGFLAKPFDMATLLELVRGALNRGL